MRARARRSRTLGDDHMRACLLLISLIALPIDASAQHPTISVEPVLTLPTLPESSTVVDEREMPRAVRPVVIPPRTTHFLGLVPGMRRIEADSHAVRLGWLRSVGAGERYSLVDANFGPLGV